MLRCKGDCLVMGLCSILSSGNFGIYWKVDRYFTGQFSLSSILEKEDSDFPFVFVVLYRMRLTAQGFTDEAVFRCGGT